MPNNLFKSIGSQQLPGAFGDAQNLISKFNEFRMNYSGNAQAEVQELLNSGRMTQAQYNRIAQMAPIAMQIMGLK